MALGNRLWLFSPSRESHSGCCSSVGGGRASKGPGQLPPRSSFSSLCPCLEDHAIAAWPKLPLSGRISVRLLFPVYNPFMTDGLEVMLSRTLDMHFLAFRQGLGRPAEEVRRSSILDPSTVVAHVALMVCKLVRWASLQTQGTEVNSRSETKHMFRLWGSRR